MNKEIWFQLKYRLDTIERLENSFNKNADDKASSMALMCIQEARHALQRAHEIYQESLALDNAIEDWTNNNG